MSQLSGDNLHLWRGEQHVLRGIGLQVAAGECLQVTGSNGAGKTTLLRALCGLITLEDGAVRWRGADIRRDLAGFHAELAYLGHENGLKADLSAAENLRFSVGLRRAVSAAQIEAMLQQVGLPSQAALLLRRLSAGQRRRVALARLALSGGALWVLDEPGSNLDAPGQRVLQGLLEQHLRQGGTAVVATHQPLVLEPALLRHLTLQ